MFWRTVGVTGFLVSLIALSAAAPQGHTRSQDKAPAKPADADQDKLVIKAGKQTHSLAFDPSGKFVGDAD